MGFVRYVQGYIWDGPRCDNPWAVDKIPWAGGEWAKDFKRLVDEHEIRIELDYLINEAHLLDQSDSWIMFAINTWFQDPNQDRNASSNKRVVMDLVVCHKFSKEGLENYEDEEGLESFEDEHAFHYQDFVVDDCNLGNWVTLPPLDLNQKIQDALSEHYVNRCAEARNCALDGKIPYDSLALKQVEFVMELQNAEGAACIDNFFVKYRKR